MVSRLARPGLYVEEAGSGAPVLALPGLGGGAWFFQDFASRLASGYRVVCPDLPGTGRSAATPAAFSLESWIRDLGGLVSSTFTEPVVIVGHSLGTILALEAWRAWPEHIRALVFVGGLPRARPSIRERLAARVEVVRRAGLAHLGPTVSPGVFAAATFRNHPEVVARFEREFEAQDAGVYIRCCGILLDADATRLVSSITVPCLSVSGAEDQYAPPDAVADFVLRVGARCDQEVLPGCGHLPFLEVPDAFAGVVRAFLDRLPDRRPSATT